MIFDFLKKNADKKKISRFIWKDKNITITPDPDYDINTSKTLTDKEKQAFKDRGKNKQ